MKVYVLNSPVLTTYGTYNFRRLILGEAQELLSLGFISAVGHESTADFMSKVLGVTIPCERRQIAMEVGDNAIVFKLLARLPEGKILDKEELARIPWELGLLRRIQ
jgi:hypothetical protein